MLLNKHLVVLLSKLFCFSSWSSQLLLKNKVWASNGRLLNFTERIFTAARRGFRIAFEKTNSFVG